MSLYIFFIAEMVLLIFFFSSPHLYGVSSHSWGVSDLESVSSLLPVLTKEFIHFSTAATCVAALKVVLSSSPFPQSSSRSGELFNEFRRYLGHAFLWCSSSNISSSSSTFNTCCALSGVITTSAVAATWLRIFTIFVLFLIKEICNHPSPIK